MSVKYSAWGNTQFFDANGDPAVGWKIYSYAAGSSTLQSTYTTAAGTVGQSNPIILDTLGTPTIGQIWLTAGLTYKFVLTDENGVVKDTQDNISGVNDASNTTSQWQASGVTPTYISASSFTLVGDQTTEFHVGRRSQFTTTAGTVYGTITAAAYASLTTVTMAMGSAQVLDAGLSAVNLSILRADNPALPGMINESRATVAGHATTAPIWAAAANSINLTGAPIYTTFPAAPQAGAKRRLYPEVGAIFTHGGAFDIIGNASFTAAANDIIDVEAITTTTFRLIPIRDSGQPVAVPSSEIRIDTFASTAAPRGSTNLGVNRFTTTRVNTGTAFSHVTNAADGSYIEILEAGIYGANGSFWDSAGYSIASITKNSADLNSSYESITPEKNLAHSSSVGGTAGRGGNPVSAVFYGAIGDRIRLQSLGPVDQIAASVQFLRIVKIG